ncbi:MAG TPA: hypothetical protein VGB59_02225 [Allosphingosinicella sp.]|jgi:hypothetical protein
MKAFAAAAALGLMLAGCEDGAPERNVTSIEIANPHSEQLKGMSELYRNLGLRRALIDAGQRCKNVERAAYQEQYKSMAIWTAHCVDSGDWAIFIAPSGDVQVRRCGNLAQLGLPQCRPIPEAKGRDKAAR